MDTPVDEIAGCRTAHVRLLAEMEGLTDQVARQPSLLPGWAVGHVLTHLARNAEASVRRVEAASRDEVVDQYVGGVEGRAAEIEDGAGRPVGDLVADVTRWSQQLDAAFAAFPAECWGRPVRSVDGTLHPVGRLPVGRWREVEVHMVDLGLGFTPEDWSPRLVDRVLPGLLDGLVERTSSRGLMAWLIGRGDAPALEPWE